MLVAPPFAILSLIGLLGFAALGGLCFKFRRKSLVAETALRRQTDQTLSVSHDLRLPLQSLLGMTDLLLQSGLNASQRRYAENLRASGGHLLRLAQSLLTQSDTDAAQASAPAQSLSLLDLLAETGDALVALADAKGLELVIGAEENVVDHRLGHALALKQILINLLGNALKYTPAGQVILRARQKGDAGGEPADMLEFRISDTGPGLPSEAKEKNPTRNATRRGNAQGGGMGLVLSKTLAEQLGGTLSLESRPNQGTVTLLCLPLKATGETFSPFAALRRMRVLLWEPRPETRRQIITDLTRFGCEVHVALSPHEVAPALRGGQETGRHLDAALLQLTEDASVPSTQVETWFAYARHRGIPCLGMAPLAKLGYALETLGQENALSLAQPIAAHRLAEALTRTRQTTAESAAPISASNPAPWLAGFCLLVAEDQPVNQIVVQTWLQGCGCLVKSVSDGDAALRLLEEMHFDAALLDCQMPGMSGFQVAHALRRHEAKTKRLPLIAMTALAGAVDRAHCLAAGMDEILVKPFSMEDLIAALKRCLPPALADAPQNPEASPDRRIDRHRLSRTLSPLANKPLAERLLRVYTQSAQKELERMQFGLRHHQVDAIQLAAHKVAGSSLLLGAASLSQLARRLESTADEGDWEQIALIVADLQQELPETAMALQKHVTALFG